MSELPARKPIVLLPGAGRGYPMGRISAVFKADEAETADAYSISEWWLGASNWRTTTLPMKPLAFTVPSLPASYRLERMT